MTRMFGWCLSGKHGKACRQELTDLDGTVHRCSCRCHGEGK